MIKIGAVADDFADAASVGILLARSGARTAAFFNVDAIEKDQTASEYDAVIVSTNSRSFPREQAYYHAAAATKALKNLGAQQFSKKIDVTLRGETGTEIDAMMDQLGNDPVAVVVPFMPQSIRTAVGEYSTGDDAARSKSSTDYNTATPVTWSHVSSLIADQTKRKVGHVGLENMLAGTESLKNALSQCRSCGNTIIIVDAVTLEDIEEIARVVLELKWNVLAVDPGAFSAKLAYLKGWISQELSSKAGAQIVQENGTALVVAGSTSPVTQKQMEILFSHNNVDHVAVNTVLLTKMDVKAESEIGRVVKSVINTLLNSKIPPRAIVVDTALCSKTMDLPAEDNKNGFSSGTCANNINNALGRIVTKIIDSTAKKVIGIYTTGEDTMVTVCSHLGTKAIELIDYVIPQAIVGRLIGDCQELPIVWKGGLAGSDHTAEDIVNHLFVEASKEQFRRRNIDG